MGAVFAHTSATADIASAPSAAVATGTRFTFLVAAVLVLVALAVCAAIPLLRPTGPRPDPAADGTAGPPGRGGWRRGW